MTYANLQNESDNRLEFFTILKQPVTLFSDDFSIDMLMCLKYLKNWQCRKLEGENCGPINFVSLSVDHVHTLSTVPPPITETNEFSPD